jgi:hypothetical protein
MDNKLKCFTYLENLCQNTLRICIRCKIVVHKSCLYTYLDEKKCDSCCPNCNKVGTIGYVKYRKPSFTELIGFHKIE